jgi:hypothetical protein
MAIATRLDFSSPSSASSPDGSALFPLQISSAPFPTGATPYVNSALGTTGVLSAAIPAVAGKTAYVKGVYCSLGGATAAGNTYLSVIGTVNASMQFMVSWPVVGGVVTPLNVNFADGIPASAQNTQINATMSAGQGAGGLQESLTITGYYL